MGTLFHQRSVRLTALVFVLVGTLWLAFARAGAVRADSVVTDCTEYGLITALGAPNPGRITFDCGGPAAITFALGSVEYGATFPWLYLPLSMY